MKRLSLFVAALLLIAGPSTGQAQQRTITGRVTAGDTGAPLGFADVQVLGTTRSTQTDPQGNFRLEVPSGEVRLRISNFGYRTREVTVSAGQSNVQVSLEVDVLNLEGIVVTGQATSVQRRNLANSVATVSAEEVGGAPTSESIEKIIQGKVAGANIETNSGAPGGGVQVRLRGVSTIIGASEPLYVVDGVVASNAAIPSNANAVTKAAGGSNPSLTQDAVVNRIADLNPNDIAKIEILKGPSAAALYGSQAANGVVLITTKKGTPGQTKITVNQRVGMFSPSNEIGFRQWTRDEAVSTFDDPSLASYFKADGTPIKSFNQEDLLTSNSSPSFQTDVTLSGGDENTRYFVSGTWKQDDGIIDNTGFEKQSVRLNVDQRFGDRFHVSVNNNLIRTLAQRGLTNNDNSGTSYYMVLPFTPNFVDLRKHGDAFPSNPFERSNPLQTAALTTNNEEVWRFLSSVNADAELLNTGRHRLQILGTAGVDYFNQKNDLLFPPELQFEPSDGLPGTSLLSSSDNRDVTLSSNLVHTYTTAEGGATATSTVGVQYGDTKLNTSRISAFGLTAGQPNVDAGVQTTLRENRTRLKNLGFFGQEEVLMMNERLLLTAGMRADRSSANGDPDKYFFYPKAAASYRLENPMDRVDALKLRVAWGQSGNEPLYGQKFTPLTATNNVNGIPALVVNGVTGDPDLQPERQSEVEFGFDATLLEGRAQLEVTGFRKTVQDLLLQRTPAPSTGFATQIFNGGEMQVNGVELALTATPLQTDRLSWISRTTFYHNSSEITDLPVPAFETGGFGTSLGAYRIEEGASATQIVANAGLDSQGNIIVKKVGDAVPTFRMGFSNDISYGRLTLSSLVDWSHGGSVINLTQFLADAGANTGDYKTDPQPFTLRDGTTVTLGKGERRITRRGNLRDSRGYIEDGSYVKVREISLSYDLPPEWVSNLLHGTVESARVTFSGRNLLTFTGYTGLDPEVSNFGNQPIARNIDVAPFPPSRSFWLSLNVAF